MLGGICLERSILYTKVAGTQLSSEENLCIPSFYWPTPTLNGNESYSAKKIQSNVKYLLKYESTFSTRTQT